MDAYSLGLMLREAREAREIEIEDAVAKLRIRQPILEGFEAGEFDIAGVPEIQIRGMLRIYARFLEQDEEHFLLLFEQMRFAQEKGRQAQLRRRRGSRQREARADGTQPPQELQLAERRTSGCRRIARWLLIMILSLLALGVIAFVTIELTGFDFSDTPPGTVSETAPLPSATAITPPPAATATETPPAPTQPAIERAQYTGSGLLLSLLVTQRSWLSIAVDGVEAYNGIAPPDTLLEYSAVGEIALTAGNALALDILWNGQYQGQIGERGQRVDMRFTLEGVELTLGPAGAPSPIVPAAEPSAVPQAAAPGTQPTLLHEAPAASPLPSATAVPPTAVSPLPSVTPLPSATPPIIITPQPTAILPPRVTQAGLPPPKAGS